MGAQGTTTVDFGAFPGAMDASVAVTGQAGIVAGSLVEAWLRPAATADHTADEHLVEPLRVLAHTIVAATGFTITVLNDNRLPEPPPVNPPSQTSLVSASATTINVKTAVPGQLQNQPTLASAVACRPGGIPRVYGVWSLAWVWN